MANRLITYSSDEPPEWVAIAVAAGCGAAGGFSFDGDFAHAPWPTAREVPPLTEADREGLDAHLVVDEMGYALPRKPGPIFQVRLYSPARIPNRPDSDSPIYVELDLSQFESKLAARELQKAVFWWLLALREMEHHGVDQIGARRLIEALCQSVDEILTENENLLELLAAAKRGEAVARATADRLELEVAQSRALVEVLRAELRRGAIDPRTVNLTTRALRYVATSAVTFAITFAGTYAGTLPTAQSTQAVRDPGVVQQLEELRADLPARCDQVINITTNNEPAAPAEPPG